MTVRKATCKKILNISRDDPNGFLMSKTRETEAEGNRQAVSQRPSRYEQCSTLPPHLASAPPHPKGFISATLSPLFHQANLP